MFCPLLIINKVILELDILPLIMQRHGLGSSSTAPTATATTLGVAVHTNVVIQKQVQKLLISFLRTCECHSFNSSTQCVGLHCSLHPLYYSRHGGQI